MGGRELQRHVEAKLATPCGSTSADGRYSLEASYCLGLCASAPAIAIDDHPQARVSPQIFDRLLKEAEAKP